MYKRTFLCLLVGLVWIAGCRGNDPSIENPVTPGNPFSQTLVAAAGEKTNVCHFDDTGGSKVISVNNNSLSRFLANGDCVTTAPKGKDGCNCSPASIASFTATPDTIDLNTSETSTLAWSTTDATNCSIDNGVGSVPCNGSTVVNPATITVYTLTAMGYVGGQDTAEATVNVQYCADISAARPAGPLPCPSGATKYCQAVQIDSRNRTHAENACNTCNGAPCTDTDFLGGKAWLSLNSGWESFFFYSDPTNFDGTCSPHFCDGPAAVGFVIPICGCWTGGTWAMF
jgi:hypothetical protein